MDGKGPTGGSMPFASPPPSFPCLPQDSSRHASSVEGGRIVQGSNSLPAASAQLSAAETVPQRFELRQLFGQQLLVLVAADEHLEHGAAGGIHEPDGTGAASVEAAVDEGDAGAIVLLDVTADGAVAVDIEPAVTFAAFRQVARHFQHDIAGLHDHQDFTPAAHLVPDRIEAVGGSGNGRTFRQDRQNLGRRHLGLGGDGLHDAIRFFSERGGGACPPVVVRLLDCNAHRLASGGNRTALAILVFVDDDVETFEMRTGEIFHLAAVLAGLGMGGAELFGFRPGKEIVLGGPDGVRSIKRVIVRLRALQHVKFDIARQFAQMRFALAPDGFECVFVTRHDAKAVHCDKHESLPLSFLFQSGYRPRTGLGRGSRQSEQKYSTYRLRGV
ncbi:hypothetical protein AGR2A_Cc200032 [Agrobacterium genomosp. 2 str. CFBP 5494]|uniref:Uncharacterized protein n=1 Tax=Agrobacterium genomosp. 2 str. CFBP 5494 TaxID=1183436 RepID=A0A9W5F087_9HYPH|nr:hypothetical protein AGR2A_Cc200032 [Agrobacterium genomosp. 2 str. CFBP 5494]